MNQEEILAQAKSIINSFHSALSSVDKEVGEAKVERDKCERVEKNGEEPNSEFREIFFKNAPKLKNECIEAEKGKWL